MSEAMERANELSFAITRRLADYREAVHAARLATQRAQGIRAEIERLERRRDQARSEHVDGIVGRVRKTGPLVQEAGGDEPGGTPTPAPPPSLAEDQGEGCSGGATAPGCTECG